VSTGDRAARPELEDVSAADEAVITAQLGRRPRALRGVAYRCPCGHPAVVQTRPRLPDGSPFPTLYYLTCARLCAAVSRLEASGVMAEMTERLATDPALAAAYRGAHEAYLAERDGIEPLREAAGRSDVSAGGMPSRVKCLHALVAHALAAGPGVNPFGDEALDALAGWWRTGPCVEATEP
jgi:hypothetical protein